jgi:hypothetical protein
MIITILAEPRTGSNNLAHWFTTTQTFTVFYEPLNVGMKPYNEYKGDTSPHTWKYDTKHLLVKEIYGVDVKKLKELISISDKLILLYRENTELQEESLKMAMYTGNWNTKWSNRPEVIQKLSDLNIDWFTNLKLNFKSEYLDNDSYFKISYEELYYNNGLQRIVDYIDLPEVQNIGFPHGKKYRIDKLI